jgi:SnoaL-like protein
LGDGETPDDYRRSARGDERIGTYRGHLEIAAAWDDFFEIADDYAVSVREIMDCGGDRVFAGMDCIATAKLSGIRATFPVFAVITLKEGLIGQVDEYMSRDEALKAAGLSE